MPTYSPKASEIERAWYVVDAEGLVLGRMATEVARVLRGKHKPIFTPHLDTGDHVIVVNADKVVLTADKAERKMVYRHSGYPGGIKAETFADLLEPQARGGGAPQRSGACSRRTASAGSSSRSSRSTPARTHPHAAQQPAAARPGRSPRAERIGATQCRSRSSRPPAAASRPSPASASAPATGTITSTAATIADYFPSDTHRMILTEPLRLTETEERYDIDATMDGGGSSGQAGALRLGIARALVELDDELRPDAEAGRLPHPRRPREGVQEVRPEEGPQGSAVLQALTPRRGRSPCR